MTVLLTTGDALDESNLGEVLGRSGISGYVERGLSIAVDYDRGTMDVSAGKAFALDAAGRDVTFLADAVAGRSIPANGVTHVYLTTEIDDPGEETYHTDQNQTPPPGPSVRIAEIDMGAQSVTEVNRETPVTDAESYHGNEIDSNEDGVVNRADRADYVRGGDVDGTVDRATAADSVDGEDVNGAVAVADRAESVDGADVNGAVENAENAQALGGSPPSSYAPADHDHAGGDISGTVPRAGDSTRFDGWTRRGATINTGSVEFPGVELATDDPDDSVFQTRFVRGGTVLNVTRLHVCDRNGGGVSNVDLVMTNLDSGFSYRFEGHWQQGTIVGFTAENDAEEVRFELVNDSGSTQRVSANVRYFFTEA